MRFDVEAEYGTRIVAKVDELSGESKVIWINARCTGDFVLEVESFDEQFFGRLGEESNDIHDAPDVIVDRRVVGYFRLITAQTARQNGNGHAFGNAVFIVDDERRHEWLSIRFAELQEGIVIRRR